MYTPVGIELPEYCEWVRGTAYPKVSSGKPHGRLQIALGVIVYSWGHERGHVASEVDVNVRVAADDVRRYLPDIEFTSYVTLQNAADEGPEIQSVPPDLVIEIVSPTQKRRLSRREGSGISRRRNRRGVGRRARQPVHRRAPERRKIDPATRRSFPGPPFPRFNDRCGRAVRLRFPSPLTVEGQA